jgi:hypothetical protein
MLLVATKKPQVLVLESPCLLVVYHHLSFFLPVKLVKSCEIPNFHHRNPNASWLRWSRCSALRADAHLRTGAGPDGRLLAKMVGFHQNEELSGQENGWLAKLVNIGHMYIYTYTYTYTYTYVYTYTYTYTYTYVYTYTYTYVYTYTYT